MSNSVFQSVIVQLRDITDRSFGVIDTEGCVVSCTDMSILGERWTDAALKVSGAADSIVTFGQRSFKAILGNSNVLEYAVFCSGDDETARSFCQMAYIALRNTYRAYYDKTISRDAAAAEKQQIRLAWERAVSRAAFDQRLTTYHVKVIRETEAAKNAFRKDPTPANALRLCNAMDGLPSPDTEGSLTP